MNYISIRVSTLRGDQKIEFNTYVKIDDKMVLYLKKGDSFEGKRLQKLKDKKLRKMFILTDEEDHYRNYLENNINAAYDSKSPKDIQTRAEIIQGDQQSKTEEVFENPQNSVIYGMAKEASTKYVDFILNNTDALDSVMKIQNTDQNLGHHGVTVATLAIALADRLGIKSNAQTQLLTLGALLHDYGHFDSTIEYTKPRSQMTEEELKIYWQHPKISSERVRNMRHFDGSVINIIYQHEEMINGKGPEGLTERQMDPLSVIVSTCNAIDRLITYEGVRREDAAKKLTLESLGSYPLKYIQLLGEILKG